MALQNDLESLKDFMGRGQMTESPRVLRRLQSGAALGHPGQLSHRQASGLLRVAIRPPPSRPGRDCGTPSRSMRACAVIAIGSLRAGAEASVFDAPGPRGGISVRLIFPHARPKNWPPIFFPNMPKRRRRQPIKSLLES